MIGPALYRAFDSADRLLYIGASINRFKRVDYHFSHQPWANEIATIRFEPVAAKTGDELARAEIAAIKKERPKYNCTHNPASPRNPANRRAVRAWMADFKGARL